MTIKTAFQWIMVLPSAALLGLLAGGFVLVGGKYLVGHWQIPSGLAIFLGGAIIPMFWNLGAMEAVPRNSRLVRLISLSPLWLLAILLLVGLAKVYQHPERLSSPASFSYSLTAVREFQILTISFILSTILHTYFGSLRTKRESLEKQRRVP